MPVPILPTFPKTLLCAAALAFAPTEFPAAAETPAPLDQALERLDLRDDWKSRPDLEFPRHPAERFLEGWVIALDPGHGGDAHRPGYKRGPTGVREADVNWRVAVLLERLLMDAGVHVVMTRHGDYDIGLRERAEIANNVRRPDGGTGADLFISLHHNATGNPETNYTSVWFHGEADWSEPDLDIARYTALSLFRFLRTDTGLTSYLMSDQQMYRGGFGVLRRTRVPAILLESSFHTSPAEEQRLRDSFYNLREAYAVYVALCEYAYGGRPTQSGPEFEVADGSIALSFEIDDGLPKNWWGANRNRTLTSSLQLFLDDEEIASSFDPETNALTATFPLPEHKNDETTSRHILRIHHANFSKNHNWPQRYLLEITRADDEAAEPKATARAIGARRAARDPELAGVADEAAGEEETTEANDAEPPRPTPLELPQGPEADDESKERLAGARPGEVLRMRELTMQELPRLPIRLTAEEGPVLVFSDMPEYFRTGDGIAMQERVGPGTVRLYTYHVPDSETDTVITAVIENLGDEPLNLRFRNDGFPTPNNEYPRIARDALTRFFNRTASLADLIVAPGDVAPVDHRMDDTRVRGDALVHGLYEFTIDQPARISTLRRPPDMTNREALETLEKLPRILPGQRPSGAGRGSFPIGNFLTTLAGSHVIDTARGAQQIIVADGRTDHWIRGNDSIDQEVVENRGNYGVLYRIQFKRSSSDGRSLAVLMHNPFSEGDPCYYMGSVMGVSSGNFEGGVVPLPRESHGFIGDGRGVLLQVFPPLPEGETGTIEILYSPPGASCLPTPIFFVPF